MTSNCGWNMRATFRSTRTPRRCCKSTLSGCAPTTTRAASRGNAQALASKTIHNFYISLCAFFTWANREFQLPNPIKAVPVPKFEQAPIEPFTKEEVEALLKACDSCNEAKTTDRRKYIMRRATGRRDQAIILTLLDTGLRAR